MTMRIERAASGQHLVLEPARDVWPTSGLKGDFIRASCPTPEAALAAWRLLSGEAAASKPPPPPPIRLGVVEGFFERCNIEYSPVKRDVLHVHAGIVVFEDIAPLEYPCRFTLDVPEVTHELAEKLRAKIGMKAPRVRVTVELVEE